MGRSEGHPLVIDDARTISLGLIGWVRRMEEGLFTAMSLRRRRLACAAAVLALGDALLARLGEEARGPVRLAADAIREATGEALERG